MIESLLDDQTTAQKQNDGYYWVYVAYPFGNLIELMEPR
jgi:hypothetical protein